MFLSYRVGCRILRRSRFKYLDILLRPPKKYPIKRRVRYTLFLTMCMKFRTGIYIYFSLGVLRCETTPDTSMRRDDLGRRRGGGEGPERFTPSSFRRTLRCMVILFLKIQKLHMTDVFIQTLHIKLCTFV